MSVNINVATATKLRTVTPSNLTEVNCQALYVGTAGNVAIVAADDTAAVTLSNVQAGSTLQIACLKVMSTNTTASNIVALYV